jgi:hypothetical protein
MLSQPNIDKLVLTGLYGHEVPLPDTGYGHDPMWCKNWTFRIVKYDDGRYVMRDSYWNSWEYLNIELTDENFDEFTFLFDFDKVTQTSRDSWQEYDEAKRFWAPTDSGGTYCGGSYFILKGAKPSKDLKREILRSQIDDAARELVRRKHDLDQLDADGMCGFYE